MSAVVDTDFLRLAHQLSCSPTDHLGAFRRIVAKLETDLPGWLSSSRDAK